MYRNEEMVVSGLVVRSTIVTPSPTRFDGTRALADRWEMMTSSQGRSLPPGGRYGARNLGQKVHRTFQQNEYSAPGIPEFQPFLTTPRQWRTIHAGRCDGLC
jgi:hypothetical protein